MIIALKQWSHLSVNYKLHKASALGNWKLIFHFIEKGATCVGWNYGLSGAAHGGHLDIIHYFIEKGADNWSLGLYCARLGGHTQIEAFFRRKINN